MCIRDSLWALMRVYISDVVIPSCKKINYLSDVVGLCALMRVYISDVVIPSRKKINYFSDVVGLFVRNSNNFSDVVPKLRRMDEQRLREHEPRAEAADSVATPAPA